MRVRSVAFVALGTLMLVAADGFERAVEAAPIIFAFEGTVNTVEPLLTGTFEVGDTLVGYFRIDSTLPDQSPISVAGQYGPLSDLAFVLGPYVGGLGLDSELFVGNNFGLRDDLRVEADVSGLPVAGLPVDVIRLTTVDLSQTAFNDTAIPTTFDLAAFGLRLWSLTFQENDGQVSGTINALQIVQAIPKLPEPESLPEPGTLSVLTSAAAAFMARAAWRRRGGRERPCVPRN